MKYKLTATYIWDEGNRLDSNGNKHQEDSLFPPYGRLTDEDRLFILCDGMGGHDAGEVASQTVCDAMSRTILTDSHVKEGAFTIDDFNRALEAAFEELDRKDTGAEKKMGTTLAFLKLFEEGAFIAHMGDSRVYHIRPGKTREETKILYVTPDHSLINDLIKAELITPQEARTSKQRNVITRAMQPGMDRRPKAEVYQTSDIKSGDYFYLCSDGMLEDPDMEDGTLIRSIFSDVCGDITKKTQILTDVTSKNRDNHSAFIILIKEVIDPIEETNRSIGNTPKANDKFIAIVEDTDKEVTPLTDNDKPLSTPETLQPQSTPLPTEVQLKKKVGTLKFIIGISLGIIFMLLGFIGYKEWNSEKNKDMILSKEAEFNEKEENAGKDSVPVYINHSETNTIHNNAFDQTHESVIEVVSEEMGEIEVQKEDTIETSKPSDTTAKPTAGKLQSLVRVLPNPTDSTKMDKPIESTQAEEEDSLYQV